MTRDFPPFSPHRLLRSAHLQTLLAAFPVVARDRRTKLEAVRVPLPGGEALGGVATWAGEEPAPAAVVIHGMGGSIESAYVVRTLRALAAAGFHAIALDLRGVGTSLPTTTSLYHAGLTADLDAAVRHLARDRRVSSLLLVGYSLGGHASLVLASEWRDDPPPKLAGVVAISPPLDLAEACRRIESWRATPYREYVLRGLKANAIALHARAPGKFRVDARTIARVRRIWEFDDVVIAPMHGFRDAAEYYARASAGPKLGNIGVPTLILAAEDDPMIPADTVRPFVPVASPRVRLAWSPRGGHVGFVESLGGLEATWAMRRVIGWLEEMRRIGNSGAERPMGG